MSGERQFGVDTDALRKAIKELEKARDQATKLEQDAGGISPGELTAQDAHTQKARQMFQDRMTGGEGSLRSSASHIARKLQEKIDAYNATLEEYGRAEDNATADAQHIERRS
ncbi:hypothetical protein DFQ14_104262 [Halopolyspora algeriensis]|uniref:Excreted virulence factor EspC (Type VII ESX diderm) n=1 Tax=Halopolyspora algeriensis TaxID=1500506 RepID=A0A368VRW4_9ACTN|nr:hypothetical protein [Halopolyspora algeriensis]RCW44672.1 hypothetical protein DFQ14_104262 [Halopolyspora algeriensis]TQM56031.1 hypothetical protein FHU43_0812 [Halopolyspora algeriensis]